MKILINKLQKISHVLWFWHLVNDLFQADYIDMILSLLTKANSLHNSSLLSIEINDKCILKPYIASGRILEFTG